MTEPPPGTPPTFDAACRRVVEHLKDAVPLGYWAVTRFDGERQLYLEVRDDAYGLGPGDSHPWADSLCVRMVDGQGPQVTGDAMSVPAYADAEVARSIPIGSYVGIPISTGDGKLFGTICGLDPETQAAELEAHAPLLRLVGDLLSMILDADLARTEAARAAERAELASETDSLTGLLNRRGWDRVLAAEEERLRRLGDPCAVVVIDLDRLKELNDRHGHLEGDRYLARTAEVLADTTRGYDHAARIGGDEFALLATRVTPSTSDELVERLQSALGDAGVAASIGVATYRIGAGLQAAYAEADAAMYEQKTARRRRRA